MQENWIGRSEGARVFFELDRSSRGRRRQRRDLHHPARHPVRRLLRWRSRPTIRWPELAQTRSRLAAFIEECRKTATDGRDRDGGEDGLSTPGWRPIHPFDPGWKLPVWVANFVLMDYGTGAIFGCPAHDQRDLDFARKYGLPVMPVVLPPGADPASFAVGDEAYVGDGDDLPLRLPGRARRRGRQGRGHRAPRGARAPASAPCITACATGACRASATGAARSRSSIATPAASCRCPRPTCRCACPTTSPSTSRAIRSTAIRPGSTSPARAAAGRRGARPTRSTPSSIPPGTSPASLAAQRPGRSTARGGATTGCRSTSISAASSMRSCTCSTRASSPAP